MSIVVSNFNREGFDITLMAGVQAATINTNQSGRDNHLKSADFFDTAKHASIVFKSSSFKSLEGKELLVQN